MSAPLGDFKRVTNAFKALLRWENSGGSLSACRWAHRSHAFGDRSAQKMTAPKGGLGSPGKEGLELEVQTPAGVEHVEVVDRFRNVPQLGEARARGHRLATHDEINAGVEVLIHSHKDGVRQPRTIDQKRGTSDPLLNR